MKKILASVATVVALTGFASAAHAAGDNTGTGGSSAAVTFDSVHSGSVAATCSLKVDDGVLNTSGAGLVSSLTSATKGKISTVCNSATSNLVVTIDPMASAASGDVIAAGITGYARTFELSGGSGAYASGLTGGFVTTDGKTNLTNGYSATASAVDVTAKVAVSNTFVLPAGNYTVNVKATVTP